MNPVEPHAWIEVDLGAIRHNYRQVVKLAGPGCRVIPVVKGNAYGHGLAEVSRALSDEGAATLAVTHVEEASDLRAAGIGGDILLLAPPRGSAAAAAVEMDVSCCVMDQEGSNELAAAASARGRRVKAHLKVDTGMGRLGVRPDHAVELARSIASSGALDLAGVYSHCAEGASEPAVMRQLRVFQACCQTLSEAGISLPLRHIAASAASLSLPGSRLDAVRIGNLIYGQYPAGALKKRYQGDLGLRDTWRFCSRIIAMRSLPPGSSVGYGAEYQTPRVCRIAVVPVGLADGLGMMPASISGKGLRGVIKSVLRPRFAHWVRLREQPAPIVGRIGMQLCSVDVTDIAEAAVGDVVELPVRRLAGGSEIPRRYTG